MKNIKHLGTWRPRAANAPANDKVAMYRWLGYNDAAAARPYCKEYDSWAQLNQLAYERGRAQNILCATRFGSAPAWPIDDRLVDVLTRKLGVKDSNAILNETSPRPGNFYSSQYAA
jgi:hypothetical protein